MTDHDQRIRLRLTGSRTSAGAIEFDALLAFGGAFRAALRAQARVRAGQSPRQPGHPPAEIREVSAFRVVALTEGSAVLELEPVDPRLLADPTLDALQDLVAAIDSVQPLDPAVVSALGAARSALGNYGAVGLQLPGRPSVVLDAALLIRLEAAAATPTAAQAPDSVDGWLHAVDFDPQQIRVRDAAGVDWVCQFQPALEPTVMALLKTPVRVTGRGSGAPPRARIDVTSIMPLAPSGIGQVEQGRSVEQVLTSAMSRAGISGPQSLPDLAVAADPDDPEEVAFREAMQAFG